MHAPTLVNPAADSQTDRRPHATDGAAASILAWTLFLLPALGVPSELVLQDTLKSAVLAFGTLLAALAWVWQQRSHPPPLRWHPLLTLPLALLLYALGSMLWSHAYLAGVEAIRWFVFSLLLGLGIQVLNRDTLPKLLWGLHAGVTVACVWAALQFWFGLTWFPQAALPASTFANRNFFAEYAVAALPLSVWLLVRLKASRWVAWVALSLAFNGVAILMTGTRSALIALCVMVPVLVLVLIRMRAQLAYPGWGRSQQVVVSVTLLLGVAVLGSLPTDNPKILQEGRGATALQRSFQRTASMAQGTEYTQGSFSVRSTMWLATARMMVANPVAGVGAGAWEVQIPLYQRNDTTMETDYYTHNEFLQLLSEYGLVVGGLVLAFLAATLILAAQAVWASMKAASHRQASAQAPRAFALCSLAALMVVSAAGFPWHLAGCTALAAVALTIVVGRDFQEAASGNTVQRAIRFSHHWVFPSVTALAGCLLLAVHITWQAQRTERHLVQAIVWANAYGKAQRSGAANTDDLKAQALHAAAQGIALNPHYRKLTAEVAEPFAAHGDWKNAVWILESVAASRPHVAGLWTGIATGYAALGNAVKADQAWAQVQRLKPDALSTVTLRAAVLAQTGRATQAVNLLTRQLDAQAYDLDMLQTGYAIGYKTQHWALAIRSLELRNAAWPALAADGFMRLGKLYAEPQVQDTAKALEAFKSGLATVPAEERANYISQVPSPFNAQM